MNPPTVLSLDDLDNVPNISWLLDGIIPDGGLCVMSGDGGNGKSMLSMDLAFAVASKDRKWLDKFDVKHGPVLFIDEENAQVLLRSRKSQLLAGLGLKSADMYPVDFILKYGINFKPMSDKYGRPVLKNGNKVYQESYLNVLLEVIKLKPVLIVIDSLVAVHSGNEDNSSDMRDVAKAISAMAQTVGASVLIDHHDNKSGKFRGSSDIKNSADSLLQISKSGDIVTVEHVKSRWGIEQAKFKIKFDGDCSSYLKLSYDGKVSDEKANVSKWLISTLSNGNGALSRQSLVNMAEQSAICKARKLDDELARMLKAGKIAGNKIGKEMFYQMVEDNLNQMIDEMLQQQELVFT